MGVYSTKKTLTTTTQPTKRWIGILALTLGLTLSQACKTGKPLHYAQGQNIVVHTDSIIAFHNNAISSFLKPYHDSLTIKMSQPIVSIDTVFSNQYTVGNLGNLTADYMVEFGNNYFKNNHLQSTLHPNNMEQYCDFAVLNNGSLRNGLSPGSISLGDIFEAMPYENILVIIQLTGAQTDSLFQHIASKNGAYLSNASCTINNKKAENILINGSRFDSRKSYILAINDYMAVGGDGYSICKQAKPVWNTGITVREALIQGLQNEYNLTKSINPRPQPRIKLMQPSNSRY